MTLAEVFRRHGPAVLARHALSSVKAKVWRAIVACRTAVLGGHVETCDGCGVTRHVHHSCRNRHCPQCQTRAKEDWLAKRRQELLPVPYFHLAFTLPHALHALIGQRPRLIYEMLFGAASATLGEFGANPHWLGRTLAISLLLRTYLEAGPCAARACARPGRRRGVDAQGRIEVAEARLPASGPGALKGLPRPVHGGAGRGPRRRPAVGRSTGRREALARPAPAVAAARLGGLREAAARRPGAGARIPRGLPASRGDSKTSVSSAWTR